MHSICYYSDSDQFFKIPKLTVKPKKRYRSIHSDYWYSHYDMVRILGKVAASRLYARIRLAKVDISKDFKVYRDTTVAVGWRDNRCYPLEALIEECNIVISNSGDDIYGPIKAKLEAFNILEDKKLIKL